MYRLSLQGIDAVIFDMDGTMVDNHNYHKKAWMEFCRRHGVNLSERDFKEKISGRKNKEILITIFGKDISSNKVTRYANEKETIYRRIYAPDIKEVRGLKRFINSLKDKKIKVAVATTAPEANRKFVIKSLALEGIFDLILGEEDVTYGKPSPEVYLKTAKKLQVDVSGCLVFEDSPAGIEAARSTGMKVVGLLTGYDRGILQKASGYIKNYTEISIQ